MAKGQHANIVLKNSSRYFAKSNTSKGSQMHAQQIIRDLESWGV